MIELNKILTGDTLIKLRELRDECVHCVVTSPPYWCLRDYGVAGQIGLEATPEEYVEKMVAVFREVRRVLRSDGTLWLNLGDGYASGRSGQNGDLVHNHRVLKPKDLIGMPWRLAFALQADGWYLRSDIIWSKPNPMPESVTDRPTKAHEYIFLLAKSERYYYDADSIREPFIYAVRKSIAGWAAGRGSHSAIDHARRKDGRKGKLLPADAQIGTEVAGRNKRSVWTISTSPFPEAHFATFPEALVQPCILAGSKESDVVLDPFMGSGTVALVALRAGRNFLGIELNPKYVEMAMRRIEPELVQLRLV